MARQTDNVTVHTYVIATNAGSAPNYDPPAVTLTVCKPRLRRKARTGELVLGFAGAALKPRSPHSVVWAGIVSEILTLADYWHDPRFATKRPDRSDVPDNFYAPDGRGGYRWQPNPVHGPDATTHDTGGRHALVFARAWRFGHLGPEIPESFGLRMIGSRRGERRHELTERDGRRLVAWLDAQRTSSAKPSVAAKSCDA